MRFRTRVVVFSAAAVALAVTIACVAAYLMVDSQLRSQVDRNLERDGSGVSLARTAFNPTGELPPLRAGGMEDRVMVFKAMAKAPAMRERFREGFLDLLRSGPGANRPKTATSPRIVLPTGPLGTPDLYAQIVGKGGRVTRPAEGELMLPVTDRVKKVAAGKEEPFFYDTDEGGQPLRVYVTGIAGGQSLQVARSLKEVEDTLSQLALVLIVVALGGIGLAVALGLFVSRAALKPVGRLSESAETIAETRDLAHRIEVEGDDELGRLAGSFNTMLAALEESQEAQRQLVADASHELRTPLTSLKTNVEVLLLGDTLSPEKKEALMRSVVAQIDEVVALIGDLIDLARDREAEGESEPLRLDELVEGVVERARHRSADPRIEFTAERCDLEGVPDSLERAVQNLIDNAIKWGPPGSRIEVEVDGGGIVTVRDQGPGVADEDLPFIFDRFYRSRAARGMPGSGLGLAMVRQIAENHEGWVTARTVPGSGAEFKIDLSARVRPAILT
ncbi:MAG TPA: HAMP domain-containing sensor histidine kinase [Solirubrobacterales bacterium]|nr:HAMP domain-containing sensor histidine kinase [Solirubrobacterales bacterium]